jgi:transposase
MHGYKTMLRWISTLVEVERIGLECTGTYNAGLM